MSKTVSIEIIKNKIYLIRGQKVMLDRDLAELYKTIPGALNQAVKRNKKRFPDDFMFQLTQEELANLKSQIVISSWGGSRSNPYAFTEQGVAMLSSVLNSQRAIEVNIQIMRVFTQLRQMMMAHKDLAAKLAEIEGRVNMQDKHIRDIFIQLRRLMLTPPENTDTYKRTKIGFLTK